MVIHILKSIVNYSEKTLDFQRRDFYIIGYDIPIPGRISMIIYLRNYDVSYEMNQDSNTVSDKMTDRIIPQLAKNKWSIVSEIDNPEK